MHNFRNKKKKKRVASLPKITSRLIDLEFFFLLYKYKICLAMFSKIIFKPFTTCRYRWPLRSDSPI